MSEYGMTIKNFGGKIIIDSTYKNHVLYDTGTTYINNGWNNINITDTTNTPFVAVQPVTSAYITTQGFVKSGSTYTHARIISLGTAGYVNWLAFKEAPTVIPDYGLVIYNTSGDPVFSTNDPYFKIVNIHTLTQSEFNVNYPPDPETEVDNYNDITVEDADNNYFYMLTYHHVRENVNQPNPPYSSGKVWLRVWVNGLKKIDSTTIRMSLKCRVVDTTPTAPLGGSYAQWHLGGSFKMLEIEDTS